MDGKYKYDVAISFADEDRNAALALALAFKAKNITAYYYPDNRGDTLGFIEDNLKNIYSKEAKYAVTLVSEYYLDEKKMYVPIELAAIQSRMAAENEIVYMVPVKMSKTVDLRQHPIFDGQAYIDWNYKPEEIVDLIYELLGGKVNERKYHNVLNEIEVEDNVLKGGDIHIGNEGYASQAMDSISLKVNNNTFSANKIQIGHKYDRIKRK